MSSRSKSRFQGSLRLWAPWRLKYIVSARGSSFSGCLFCRTGKASDDARNLVILRGRLSFCILNRYPYNNGHLMVAPYRHVGQLAFLTPAEWQEILDLTNESMARLEKVMAPHGYNIGSNLGRTAGAGIPGHLHLHVVPRWTGDNNFMPVVAGTKVISQALSSAYSLLRGARETERTDAKKIRRRASDKKRA